MELLISNTYIVEYVDAILRDERISLNDPVVMNFMELYFPKVCIKRSQLMCNLTPVAFLIFLKNNEYFVRKLLGVLYIIY